MLQSMGSRSAGHDWATEQQLLRKSGKIFTVHFSLRTVDSLMITSSLLLLWSVPIKWTRVFA